MKNKMARELVSISRRVDTVVPVSKIIGKVQIVFV